MCARRKHCRITLFRLGPKRPTEVTSVIRMSRRRVALLHGVDVFERAYGTGKLIAGMSNKIVAPCVYNACRCERFVI